MPGLDQAGNEIATEIYQRSGLGAKDYDVRHEMVPLSLNQCDLRNLPAQLKFGHSTEA
jgi:hypothetical protein